MEKVGRVMLFLFGAASAAALGFGVVLGGGRANPAWGVGDHITRGGDLLFVLLCAMAVGIAGLIAVRRAAAELRPPSRPAAGLYEDDPPAVTRRPG